MKITEDQLDKAIASLGALELEQLVRNIVCSLYGQLDEETGKLIYDSAREWEQSAVESVASDIDGAGLNPNSIGQRYPVKVYSVDWDERDQDWAANYDDGCGGGCLGGFKTREEAEAAIARAKKRDAK